MTDLVTGFPGFIGRRLVACACSTRTPTRASSRWSSRGCSHGARRSPSARRPSASSCSPGTSPTAASGCDDDDYERLRAEVRRVFHLAAIYDLAVPLELAQRVNVEGTGNVLDLCRAAEHLERLAYVSTAYVAGLRTGVVYEHELVDGPGFKNHYESTKFQAEVWVRELLDEVPTTILRPAIVVGDSHTGETEKFDGPYYILRASLAPSAWAAPIAAVRRAPTRRSTSSRSTSWSPRSRRPATTRRRGADAAPRRPRPADRRDLVALLSRAVRGPRAARPRARRPGRALAARRAVREMFEGTPRESIAYLNHPVVYDARRTVDLLAPHGLVPPKFGEYAAGDGRLLPRPRGRPRAAAEATRRRCQDAPGQPDRFGYSWRSLSRELVERLGGHADEVHPHAPAAERHALGLQQASLARALGQRAIRAHDPVPGNAGVLAAASARPAARGAPGERSP